MQKSYTNRGFGLIEFTDSYGEKCSIQESSSASDCAIWLGINEANPIVMASQALEVGISTHAKVGWIPYPIPSQVLLSTRMHLTRKQVKELLPILKHFLKTGGLDISDSKL